MNYDKLLQEKKRVKNELKSYDMTFQTLFNRQPSRTEKEPMRPLYENKPNPNPKEPQNIDPNPIDEDRLQELKAERSILREKLHEYQLEFIRVNNRKIRYHRDIAPVENEYKRYKELKAEIAKIENTVEENTP